MKRYFYLYVTLCVCVIIQAVSKKYVIWSPDIVLVMVVFYGIFFGELKGAVFGGVAGFFRGCFSVDTACVDIFIFSAVGIFSSVLSRMFYRHNPVAQFFITVSALCAVLTAHTFFLSMVSGNDIRVFPVIGDSWRTIAVTAAVSPVLFVFFKALLRVEE
ncbi:MAG: hypothetical protein ABIA77_06460 [Candidatus Omnitrophota bacterium]